MKKTKIAVAAILLAGASMTFSSCIGSFQMTNRVLSWNRQVGNKFVNELVFFAFWIIPVYEVTSACDLLVINSIEFWSGKNPLSASTKCIDTEHGRYLIDCDGKGYTITLETTGEKTRLEFFEETNTWAVIDNNNKPVPFMTFIDDNHVKMIKSNGDFETVELSSYGVMAYASACGLSPLAQN